MATPSMDADELVDEFAKMSAERSAALPPGLEQKRDMSVDELMREMNKVPLFMTSIDENDEEQAAQLEAIRAIAYEGSRAEIAANFKTQGNECVAQKLWTDAREFYSKAITALRDPNLKQYEAPDVKVVEIDEEAEKAAERELEEACLTNRALCNLELSIAALAEEPTASADIRAENYGSCNRDCAAALRLSPRNVKAWYRAASACLALDRVDEALDACDGGLKFDPKNAALATLRAKVVKRSEHLTALSNARQAREEREKSEKATLALAIKSRAIAMVKTPSPPDMEDAAPALADPTDPKSILSLPVIFLYPLTAQSDFIKAVSEEDVLADHLSYVLPPPWDEESLYSLDKIDCYMETATGGLIKAGKKVKLIKLLEGGKVPVFDGLVKINIVPREQASTWIEAFKVRRSRP